MATAPAVVRITGSAAQFVAAVTRAVEEAERLLTTLYNHPVKVAGIEARYYTRAGLDPAYATSAALDDLVAAVLNGDVSDTRFLTIQNRGRVAAQAVAGWVAHRPQEAVAPPVWFRLVGDQPIEVTVAGEQA